MSRSKYTAERLRPLVASSNSLAEVIRKLRLKPTGGNHRYISTRIRLAELDTSHFHGGLRGRIDQLTREILEPIVSQSRSIASVLSALNLPVQGGAHRELSRRLRELLLDTSHFQGQGWSKGFTRETHPSVKRTSSANRIPDDQVFIANGAAINGPSILKRLLEKGVEYCCVICGIFDWCGRPLVLHVDHINGIHNDHRRENLRLLCPNCHSQTDTYCNKAREPALCYTVRLASVA